MYDFVQVEKVMERAGSIKKSNKEDKEAKKQEKAEKKQEKLEAKRTESGKKVELKKQESVDANKVIDKVLIFRVMLQNRTVSKWRFRLVVIWIGWSIFRSFVTVFRLINCFFCNYIFVFFYELRALHVITCWLLSTVLSSFRD